MMASSSPKTTTMTWATTAAQMFVQNAWIISENDSRQACAWKNVWTMPPEFANAINSRPATIIAAAA